MAEGCGVLILEDRDIAMRRGARIYAELVGYGATADAHHLSQPAPEGEGAQRAMKAALRDAKVDPREVDYVNAHGTSTGQGDLTELEAIQSVFGGYAKDGLMLSSTKSMTGHLLGAAGGLEAVISVLAIRDGVVPPTINLDNPDEGAAGFDLVPHTARQKKVRVVLSNSFGFGGTNVALVFKQHD
jgi:3-oxoacyl-[acyl-carrier-protein] synthase II